MNDQKPDSRGDLALARRMLSGDEAAFDEFIDTHFPGLYRFALGRVGQNADAAEEVVQAAIVKAIRRLETYRGEAALFSWLCTFCRHEIGAFYRERGQAPSLSEDTAEIRAALESLAASDDDDPESRMRRKQLSRIVQVTLDYLPRHYGDALEWKYIEGVSVAEIGVRLSIGTKAAESLLTRARVAFRDGFGALALEPEESQ